MLVDTLHHVRWERLFDDLEAQLRTEEARELAAEVADRTRRERALVGLHDQFAAAADRTVVELRVAGVGLLRAWSPGVARTGSCWTIARSIRCCRPRAG